MKVHQFTPILEPGAIGSHTLMVRGALREAGHTSEIYTSNVHRSYARQGARSLHEYRRGADLLVYHLAIGSPVANMLLGRREPLVVNHHNLTPLRYLESWHSDAARGVVWGRAQLRELARRATLGIGDSRYNEVELIEAGYARTAVVPILFDPRSIAIEPDPAIVRSDETTWLFVGRLAANKAQHDIVKAFAAYRQFHDRHARLRLVGGGVDDPYGRTLRRYIEALGLEDAVTLTGAVSAAELAAYYATADVFVVCSEHEGFCVPLLEAMQHSVPIVAFAAAAVPETLGDAGLLLEVKDACTVAAAVDRVVHDAALRDQLVAAGTARVQRFDVTHTGPEFVRAITSVADR
jgi:L-malate glycosyltransferase